MALLLLLLLPLLLLPPPLLLLPLPANLLGSPDGSSLTFSPCTGMSAHIAGSTSSFAPSCGPGNLWNHTRTPLVPLLPVEPPSQPSNSENPQNHGQPGTLTQHPLDPFPAGDPLSQLSTFDPPQVHRHPRTRTRYRLEPFPPVEPSAQPSVFDPPQIHRHPRTRSRHRRDPFPPAQPLSQPSVSDPPQIHRQSRTRTRRHLDPFPPVEVRSQTAVEGTPIQRQTVSHTPYPLDHLLPAQLLLQPSISKAPRRPRTPGSQNQCHLDAFPSAEPLSLLSYFEPAYIRWLPPTHTRHPVNGPPSHPSTLTPPLSNCQRQISTPQPLDPFPPSPPLSQHPNFQHPGMHWQMRTYTTLPLDLHLPADTLFQLPVTGSALIQRHPQTCIQHPLKILLLVVALPQPSRLESLLIHQWPHTCLPSRLEPILPVELLFLTSDINSPLTHQQLLIGTQWSLEPHPPAHPEPQVPIFEPQLIHSMSWAHIRCPLHFLLAADFPSQPSVIPAAFSRGPLDFSLLAQHPSLPSISPSLCSQKQPSTCSLTSLDRCLPHNPPTKLSAFPAPPLGYTLSLHLALKVEAADRGQGGRGDIHEVWTSVATKGSPRAVHNEVLLMTPCAEGLVFPWPEDLGLGTDFNRLSCCSIISGALSFLAVLLFRENKRWRRHEKQLDFELQLLSKTMKLGVKTLLALEEELEFIQTHVNTTIPLFGSLSKEVSELRVALRTREEEKLRLLEIGLLGWVIQEGQDL